MAGLLKTLKPISGPFSEQTTLLLLIALVISYLTLLWPFISPLRKQIRNYLRETFKLGCKDVRQSQKMTTVFSDLNLNIKVSQTFLELNYQIVLRIFQHHKPTSNFRTFLTTSNLRYSQRTKKYCFNHKINSCALENVILSMGSILHIELLDLILNTVKMEKTIRS